MPRISVMTPVLRRTRRFGRVVALAAAGSVLAAVGAPAAQAAASANASRAMPSSCPQRKVLVACVDQDHQRMWVQQGSKIVFPAVTVRTGRPGLRTPDGLYRIYWRHQHQYSYKFDEPMPYSLFFFRGYALHATYDDIRRGGSHGCVNLSLANARKVFELMDVGDLVYIWGHKHSA